MTTALEVWRGGPPAQRLPERITNGQWLGAASETYLANVQRAYALSALEPDDYSFNFAGRQYYGVPTELPARSTRIDPTFIGYANGCLRANSVIFALEAMRIGVFSDVRFQWQRLRGLNGRPGDLFGSAGLDILERPWPRGTTSSFLARTLLDADLAGNSFWAARPGGLKRMRPDWVTIHVGSLDEPELVMDDLDAEVIGYTYWPGGFGTKRPPILLTPDEVIHFYWMPDPENSFKGMSWIGSVVREIEADSAATVHKLNFFRNGASQKYVLTFPPEVPLSAAKKWQAQWEENHQGAGNAYRTAFMGLGADVKVVGADMRQLDFKVTQGAGETRLASAARTPPVLVGLSEGLNAATYSNYGLAKKSYGETTMANLWRDMCGSTEHIVDGPPPGGPARLWYDTRDVAFLREDAKVAAELFKIDVDSWARIVQEGGTPDSATLAVQAHDLSLIKHSGRISVQLHDPNEMPGDANASVGAGPPPEPDDGLPSGARRSEPLARRAFDPTQRRDSDGKWTTTGGAVGRAARKAVGKPKLLSPREFESAYPPGSRYYRGVGHAGGAKSTQAGDLGSGDYGPAIYVGSIGTAQGYAGRGDDGRVLRVGISPDAKVARIPNPSWDSGRIEAWAEKNGVDVIHIGGDARAIRNPAVAVIDAHAYTPGESVVLDMWDKGYDVPDEYRETAARLARMLGRKP